MKPLQLSRYSTVQHAAVIGLSAGSGCAALVYEIVWFQMLELVLGSSAVSLAILLGTFMGGMCLGSLLLPKVVSSRHHPLRVYAIIELAIGSIGIALMLGIPRISVIYAASDMQGLAGLLLRGGICAVLLMPPTILMGAALPCLARLARPSADGMSWLGGMYAGNIVGAIFGCVMAGFYLLRLYDMPTATYFAAAVNGTVAVVSAVTAFATFYRQAENNGSESPIQAATRQGPPPWAVYLTIALSGLTALGAEVTWTRLLSLLLGPTVYTFSIILAVFLLGLGLGSAAASRLLRHLKSAAAALAACQFLLVAAIAWSAFMIAAVLPFWPIDRALAPSPWVTYQIDVLRCVWAILPAAIFWGASFPLALAAASSRQQDAGWIVGAVYASNTVGAILGALSVSLIFIPWLGTQQSQRLLIVLSFCGGLLVCIPLLRSMKRSSAAASERTWSPGRKRIGVVAAVVLAGLIVYGVPMAPPQLIAYGPKLLKFSLTPHVLYVGEGVTSSVAVTEYGGKVRYFHIGGKVVASTLPADLRQERMLGHLSALLHPNPRSVLVVGFGAGITAGTFTLYPGIKRIVICEIEPLIPQNVGSYFKQANYDVLHDPRVKIVYDDARHYILTSKEKFDVITSDPIHPWVKGAGNLYTQQYFELVKKRLNPGGVVTQWIPLYESTRATVKSELATFFEVLPGGILWANDRHRESYDLVVSGSPDPTPINLDEIEKRLSRPDYARVLASLREVHFASGIDLLGTYLAQHADVKPWLKDAQINTDKNLRLQYLAGFKYDLRKRIQFSAEIRRFRWLYPPVTGSYENGQALLKAIQKNQ
jgi:spermidine synthase